MTRTNTRHCRSRHATDPYNPDDPYELRYGEPPWPGTTTFSERLAAELTARDAELKLVARSGGFVDGAQAALNELASHFKPEAPDAVVFMAEVQRWTRHIADTFFEKLSKAVELALEQVEDQ